ncbi:MAG: c-type cytochrome domain-containing protein [Verrucomicrobiales bacterium]
MDKETPISQAELASDPMCDMPVQPSPHCCGKAWVIVGSVAAAVIALVAIAVPLLWEGPDPGKLSPWTEYFGTLHPMILHMPVGIVILVVTLESLGWMSFGRYKPQTTLALAIGLLSAVAAATLGYLLFMTGDYGKATLDRGIGQHLWGTIAFIVLLSAAFAVKLWNDYDRRKPVLYGFLLIAATGALTLGAHEGAVITHGSDPLDGLKNLLNPQKGAAAKELPVIPASSKVADLLAYDQVVVPLLNRYCYECHSEAGTNPVHAAGKVKGKLAMTTIEALKKGGSSDVPALVPGDVAASLMIEVMRYPLDDEEHMPPEDSDQPSADEIALLEWWINAGAPTDKSVAEVGGADALFPAIEALLLPAEANAVSE